MTTPIETMSPTPKPLALPRPERATLLVVDVQERLLPAMPVDDQLLIVKQLGTLVALFAEMRGAIIWSEQYPKGLGVTVPALAAPLAAAPGAVKLEKVEFSVARCPAFAAVAELMAPDVVLTGMETHVCVLQTGLDLLARGHRVWVPFDAVGSRKHAYKDNGLALLERAGAVVVNTETLVFAALEKAGGDVFKRFSALIR